MNSVSIPLRRLLNRPDFRESPVKAIYKRFAWRWRWSQSQQPWRMQLENGTPIFVPRTGPGALIYYQGTSEPDVSEFIASYLHRGMTFYDVGAHIGEYALRASLLVGSSGYVHAFEPQPDMLEVLYQNVSLNRLSNVTVNGCAITNQPGTVEFNVRAERAVSSLSHTALSPVDGQRLPVPAETLDAYSAKTNSFPHLIKIDVEGAEHLVLQGASQVLSAPPGQAPALVLEYCLENYRTFGVHPAQVIDLLLRHGYTFHIWRAPGLRPATDVDLKETTDLNLIALKM